MRQGMNTSCPQLEQRSHTITTLSFNKSFSKISCQLKDGSEIVIIIKINLYLIAHFIVIHYREEEVIMVIKCFSKHSIRHYLKSSKDH